MFSVSDTIVAVATPPGHGGIGVVRLSGADAPAIARGLTLGAVTLQPRHATFVRLVDPDASPSATLDQVVITWFQAPHSYTGDDVVEISAHGSPVLLRRIVELAMRAGARLAEPGEYTLRAYLNGRIDLVQAEAVADLVDAVTPLQARAAMDQLEGTLTSAIGRIDAMLFDLAARLEASLDFPDEGFHFITREEAGARLSAVRAALDALAREGRAGRLVREGRTLVIAGLPNAGKSSLFNALAGASRAIVAEMPGTTRDLVTERVEIDGVPVTLVDTAGLRDAGDVVEIEGVRRARDAQAVAALRLVLVDGSVPLQAAAIDLVRRTKAPRLIVATKRDLPRAWELRELGQDAAEAVDVSVVSGAGLAELRARAVQALAGGEPLRDVPAISNVRHLALVDDARAAVSKAAAELQEGATEELVLAELTAARRALEAITGRRSPDELLKHIFERFCVGK
jgi:tRNA modification GTPase